MTRRKQDKKTESGKTVINTETIKKLIEGFGKGLSVRECAGYANIGKTTLYNYLSENTEFKDKVKTLQLTPKMLAKLVIVAAIQAGDAQISMWYLEKEFKKRTERERARLLRQQRKTLERADNPEQAPGALVDLTGHWARVDAYFRGEYTEPKKQDGEIK